MKIVHIAPNAPYNDNWGYQENLLPKYQKRLGHDVTLIITNTMHQNGKIVETDCADYVSDDGVRIVRLAYKKSVHRKLTTLFAKLDVLPYLEDIKPDFIFFHGLVSNTIFDVVRYKKKIDPKCVIVQDNHLDYYNRGVPVTFRSKCIRAFYRAIAAASGKHIAKYYGVTPWRKTFAQDYFKVPESKTDVLIMGADDDAIDFENRDVLRQSVRAQYNVGQDDFLIVTGGKIDGRKKIDVLMEACSGMDGIKLLVFGNVSEEMKPAFDRLVAENPNISFLGWVDARDVYQYFFAADLIAFPGSHSVLWEQACAAKVPCLFRRFEGMDHVDNGGNSEFIDEISVDSLRTKINELKFTEKYERMKTIALSEKTDVYLYSRIAEKSLETMYEDRNLSENTK